MTATDCLTVAASGVITDYMDVMVRGYLKEHTDFVAYRLDILEKVIATVRERVAVEHAEWRRSDVSFGQGPPDPEREHHEQVAEYAAHRCDCDWCLHAQRGPDDLALDSPEPPGDETGINPEHVEQVAHARR